MSERDDELDPRLARALEALSEERPDARFERALRARFVDPHASAAPPRAPRRRAVARRGPRPAPWIALASAAALVLVAALWWRGSRPAAPSWRVLSAEGTTTLDGRPLDAERLAAGGRLVSGDGATLRLVLGEELALAIGPASEIVLPAVPAGDGARAWLLEARAGHLAVATGAAFQGSRLAVQAPDARVEVVGTRFAVDVYDQGTCVCCSEGRVRVDSLREGTDQASVAAGGMAYAHTTGGLATGAVLPDHVEPLIALEQAFE